MGIVLFMILALVNGVMKISTACGTNATYSVVPLGERIKWKDYMARSAVYVATMMASGAISGFIYTVVIFLISYWMPFSFKSAILLILAFLYLMREVGLLSLPLPQNRWQIPTDWVNRSPLKNSLVWGMVLGPGIFTFNPHFTFYIFYLYIGFFFSPPMGLLGGAVYGFCRCLPSLLLAAQRNRKPDLFIEHRLKAWSFYPHALALSLTTIYMGYIFSQSLQ